MFKRGEKTKNLPVLRLYAEDGHLLYDDRLDAFPFPEAVMLEGCEEFFDDPNPCEIHRRALQLRLCAEIESMLPVIRRVSRAELPPAMLLYCGDLHPCAVELEKKRGLE